MINITRFSIGPKFRFNNGNSQPIRGTNLLTSRDERGNKIYTDLPDDDWLAEARREAEIDKFFRQA